MTYKYGNKQVGDIWRLSDGIDDPVYFLILAIENPNEYTTQPEMHIMWLDNFNKEYRYCEEWDEDLELIGRLDTD